jgi:hypothetical protein
VSQMVTHSRSALTIWGDPVVGRTLVLLLRDSGYKAGLVSSLSSTEPFSLEGSQLLVLTPTPQLSIEMREALLALLRKRARYANVPVLELVTAFEESRQRRTRDNLWYTAPWPCRIEELERRIEGTLPFYYELRRRSSP